MNNLVENQFGHGALPHIEDIRDYKFARASDPYDWTQSYDIETLVGTIYSENQGTSFSCGGSWAYLQGVIQALKTAQPYQRKSRFYPYSQVFVAGGGSDGRTLCQLCVAQGVSQETLCPSYNADGTPLTEEQYEMPNNITSTARADASTDKALAFANTDSTDIDAVAEAIVANGGLMFGVYGINNGTWLSADPLPPSRPDGEWAHWVFAGKVAMRNGNKAIGIKNSWGNIAENGWQWLSEDYFTSGNVWVAWGMTYNMQNIIIPTVTPQVQAVLNKSTDPVWKKAFLYFYNLFNK